MILSNRIVIVEEESPTTTAALPEFREFNGHKYYLPVVAADKRTMENPAIAVLGCRRMDMLLDIVSSLSSMASIQSYSVYVSLGCPEAIEQKEVESFIRLSKLPIPVTVLQFQDPQAFLEKPSLFLRIQQHYSFILSELFEKRRHSHVIVLEDDLQLSSSLLEFFEQTASLLDEDPSIACISAFNDNA